MIPGELGKEVVRTAAEFYRKPGFRSEAPEKGGESERQRTRCAGFILRW
jgi:hypothetical protein